MVPELYTYYKNAAFMLPAWVAWMADNLAMGRDVRATLKNAIVEKTSRHASYAAAMNLIRADAGDQGGCGGNRE
jgi:hypothetical protein